MPNKPQRCRHLHTSGLQCGSPAVRHEKLCYQHLAATQRPSYTPTLPDPEDLHAVQRGLAELLRLVARELIEDKQARRLFAILTAAGTNLARIDRARHADRELDLRARALHLAQTRLATQHPAPNPVILSEDAATPNSVILSEGAARVEGPAVPTNPGCPTFDAVSSRLRWDRGTEELPVTEPIHDPILGPLAPGPDPEPRPQPGPEDPGCPTVAAVSSPLRWDRAKPQPEQLSRARQAELDAEAAEQIEFDRRERARSEERASLRRAAYQVMYQNLSPEAKLKEDERYAAEVADHFHYTLEEIAALPSTPIIIPLRPGDRGPTPLTR